MIFCYLPSNFRRYLREPSSRTCGNELQVSPIRCSWETVLEATDPKANMGKPIQPSIALILEEIFFFFCSMFYRLCQRENLPLRLDLSIPEPSSKHLNRAGAMVDMVRL